MTFTVGFGEIPQLGSVRGAVTATVANAYGLQLAKASIDLPEARIKASGGATFLNGRFAGAHAAAEGNFPIAWAPGRDGGRCSARKAAASSSTWARMRRSYTTGSTPS